MSRSRRDFLRIAAAGSLAVTNSSLLWGRATVNVNANKVRAWSTSKDRKFEELKAPEWRATPTDGLAAIQIDPSKQYQDILGFGAAFTDASCYLFSQMAPKARQALYSDLFGNSGLRLSVGRTCIGASDYSINT